MKAPESVYTDRIGAEVEAKAEEWRCRDQEITQLEHEIDQAWVEIAPSEAASENELPLDQAEKLSMINPNVPIESRLGVRRIKWLIRKLTYWYIRFLTDQFNAVRRNADPTSASALKSPFGPTWKTPPGYPADQPVPISMVLAFLTIPPSHPLQIACRSVPPWLASRARGQCLVLSGGER